jgi:disulfide bond formation protein DsbB
VTGDLSRLFNALGLILVSLILVGAFFDQFWNSDLPCPLCLLQRAGFVAAGFGLALNLVFGPKPSHYGLTILGAAAGAVVALRQIVLHIVPGTGAYGDQVLGLHLYTWSFILFGLIVVGGAIMLLGDRQFARVEPISSRLKPLPLSALSLFTLIAVTGLITTFALCGPWSCPEDPEQYWLIKEYFSAPN